MPQEKEIKSLQLFAVAVVFVCVYVCVSLYLHLQLHLHLPLPLPSSFRRAAANELVKQPLSPSLPLSISLSASHKDIRRKAATLELPNGLSLSQCV